MLWIFIFSIHRISDGKVELHKIWNRKYTVFSGIEIKFITPKFTCIEQCKSTYTSKQHWNIKNCMWNAATIEKLMITLGH